MLLINTRITDGNPIVEITGEIDMAAVEGFRRVLSCLLEEYGVITIDASGLQYIYSDGLGVLIEVATKLRRTDGHLRILNPPKLIRQILERTRLESMLPMLETRD